MCCSPLLRTRVAVATCTPSRRARLIECQPPTCATSDRTSTQRRARYVGVLNNAVPTNCDAAQELARSHPPPPVSGLWTVLNRTQPNQALLRVEGRRIE